MEKRKSAMTKTTDSEFTSPAPYGQACFDCSRAKCKCMRRPTGGICERCLRRGIECRPPTSARQRGTKGLGSRTTRLEEKLDTLVTLLQSSSGTGVSPGGLHPSAASDTPPGTTPSTGLAGDSSSSRNLTQDLASNVAHSDVATAFPAGQPPGNIPARPVVPQEHPENVSEFEAEETLQRFRSQLKYFPFVHLPPTTTAADLQQSRPFLWICILAVSTRSSAKQAALSRKVQRIIADRLVVQHERNLDLLLGLLAILGWANYQLGPGQPVLGVQCHLLIALIQDLGIEKASKKFDEPNHPMACLKNHYPMQRLAQSTARTVEERRALLAGYLISSEVSSFRNYCFNRTLEGLRWTPHLEASLQVLEQEREAPLDPLLATMVRLKVVGDEATKPPWYMVQPTEQSSFQYVMQSRALQSRIAQIKQEASADAEYNKIIQLFTLSTELEISEVGLYNPLQKRPSVPDVHRLSMLSSCVQAARVWLDVFFALDTTEFADAGFSIWCRVSHVITSLYRLSLYEEPGWDKALVRETVDVMNVLDKLIQRLSAISVDAGLVTCDRTDGGGDHFSNSVKSIRTIKAAWMPVLGGGVGSGSGETGAVPVESLAIEEMDLLSSEFLEGVNGWMSDMIVSWEPITM